jgi:hypothetical protein
MRDIVSVKKTKNNFLKGRGHEMKFCFKGLLYMCLFEEKINEKFLLAYLKTLRPYIQLFIS